MRWPCLCWPEKRKQILKPQTKTYYIMRMLNAALMLLSLPASEELGELVQGYDMHYVSVLTKTTAQMYSLWFTHADFAMPLQRKSGCVWCVRCVSQAVTP